MNNSWIIQIHQLRASLGWDKTMDTFCFGLDQGQISGKLIFIVHTQTRVLWYVKTFNFIISWYHLIKKTVVKSVAKDLMIPWYRYYLSPKSAYTSYSFCFTGSCVCLGRTNYMVKNYILVGFISARKVCSRDWHSVHAAVSIGNNHEQLRGKKLAWFLSWFSKLCI